MGNADLQSNQTPNLFGDSEFNVMSNTFQNTAQTPQKQLVQPTFPSSDFVVPTMMEPTGLKVADEFDSLFSSNNDLNLFGGSGNTSDTFNF